MARFLEKLGTKVSNWLKRGKPKVPKLESRVFGHRGVAAGSVRRRAEAGGVSEQEIVHGKPGFVQIGREATRRAFTPEEIAEFEILTPNETDNFVKNGAVVQVHSSNVCGAQFLPKTGQMIVEYGAGDGCGSFYLYSSITPEEALSFIQSPSKGGWIWRYIRVQNSKYGHKKPYSKCAGYVKTTSRGFVS